MHSSQYVVEQQGVSTACEKSLEQIGQASVASGGDSSRTSDSVTILGLARCFSQAALLNGESERVSGSTFEQELEGKNVHVWLSDDKTSLGRDHDTSRGALGPCGSFYGLEETARDTGRALEPRLVVELFVLVRRTGLDPVT